MQRDYVSGIEQKFGIASGNFETMLLVEINGKKVIFPRIGRVNTIAQFFYKTYKAKSAKVA